MSAPTPSHSAARFLSGILLSAALLALAIGPAAAQQTANTIAGQPGSAPMVPPQAPVAPMTVIGDGSGSSYLDTWLNWQSYTSILEQVQKAREAEAAVAEARQRALAGRGAGGSISVPPPGTAGFGGIGALPGSGAAAVDSTAFNPALPGSGSPPAPQPTPTPLLSPSPPPAVKPISISLDEAPSSPTPKPTAFVPYLVGLTGSAETGLGADIVVGPSQVKRVYAGDDFKTENGTTYVVDRVATDLVLLKQWRKSIPLMMEQAPPRAVGPAGLSASASTNH